MNIFEALTRGFPNFTGVKSLVVEDYERHAVELSVRSGAGHARSRRIGAYRDLHPLRVSKGIVAGIGIRN